MKKQRTMMITIVTLLILLFSSSLIVMSSYNLSIGFSYHLSSELGNTINITCILGGSILALGDVFFIFFIYLPRQKEKRLAMYRGIARSYQHSTEGQAGGQLRQLEESQPQALTTSIQIIAAELEQFSVGLAHAQKTIERLAHEAQRQAGHTEELERELEAAHQRVTELEAKRDQ